MKKIYLPLVVIAILLALSITVAAQRTKITFDGSSSDRWTNTANWNLNRIPKTGDSIVIPNGMTAYVGPSSSDPTSNIVLNNVIIVVQKGGTLQIGNGGTNFGTLTLDNASAISVEATGSTRGSVTASPVNASNKITIGGTIKFQGNLHYTVNTGSGTGIVTGPARATSGTSGFTLGTLPVVLVGFNANLTAGNKVNIAWNTQQEISTDHFEIQRSNDGLDWQTLSTVKASGFSSIPKSYSGSDASPEKGINLYRLKMVDIDGNFGFSGIVNVRLNLMGKVSLYPNPSVNTVTVSLSEVPASDWTVSIINTSGQTILQKQFSKDLTTVSLSVGNYPTGNYTMQVSDGLSSQVSRLLIAHQ